MTKPMTLLVATASLFALFTPPALRAQTGAPTASGEICKFSKDLDLSTLKTEKAATSLIEQDGKTKLKVEFTDVAPFPNVQFLKPGEPRDLSAFTGVQADVTNTGKEAIRVGMRVDNAGDMSEKPWNSGGAVIPPGETQTIQVIFGKSWGSPGFALDPKQVTNVQIYGFSPPIGSGIIISDLKAF